MRQAVDAPKYGTEALRSSDGLRIGVWPRDRRVIRRCCGCYLEIRTAEHACRACGSDVPVPGFEFSGVTVAAEHLHHGVLPERR